MMKKRKLMWEELDKCTYRNPTESELAEALALEKERNDIMSAIHTLQEKLHKIYNNKKSRVFYDTAGHPYDVRTYIASGRTETI